MICGYLVNLWAPVASRLCALPGLNLARVRRTSLLHYARQGVITEEMAHVAKRENLPESLIMEEVARGRMIIPANINHANLEPMAIGTPQCGERQHRCLTQRFRCRRRGEEAEAAKYGADTVMDLSTGGVNLDEVRTAIIDASPVPIGTVPLSGAGERVRSVG